MFTSSLLALVFAASALAQDASPTCGICQSFGIDFQSGGTYFQNSLSTDPFTAVEEFEGCSNDTAMNVLVDPNGDQYQCSNTPMQPDDTPETLSCPLDKDQLFSGDWSILIISNNGNCEPIAFERDFSLSVGPQSTITVSPTLTISTVFTPVESDIDTLTQTITSSTRPRTTTVPAFNFNPTITIQPLPQVTVVTKAILTLTSTSTSANIIATSTEVATASCQLPQRRLVPDPVASIVPTIIGGLLNELGLGNLLGDLGLKARSAEPTAAPMSGRSASTEYKRAIIEGRAVAPAVKARFLAERSEYLSLNKRDVDEPTITVTADSPAATVTSTSTAPTSTITGTTTLVVTSTVTPVVTKSQGIAAGISVVTAPARTLTNTFFVPATTVYQMTTQDVTLTITSTTTPAAVLASCTSAGGVLS